MSLPLVATTPTPAGPDATAASGRALASLSPAGRATVTDLRRRVHALLTALAARVEQTLGPALEVALRAWDQADELFIVDPPLDAQLTSARLHLDAALASPEAPVRAVATEAILTLRAACGLVALVESRLSHLIRLRVRVAERDVLPNGRPSLDVAPALQEAARGWS